jgi:hypothetical protein
MGAGVLEGVEVAINVEQREPLAVDFDPSGLTGREFVCLGDFQRLSHLLLLRIAAIAPEIGPLTENGRHSHHGRKKPTKLTPAASGGGETAVIDCDD